MADSTHAFDVDEANFQELVVAASKETTILVDFWAPWCGPCRALSPLLEELADEDGSTFKLAKVNVDENPQLAGLFNVASIPAVFAIKDAKVVDQFSGLLDETMLREFLAGLNPSEDEVALAAAMQLAMQDQGAGLAVLRSLHARSPQAESIRIALASLLIEMHEAPAEAAELLRTIESGEFADDAGRLKRILALQELPHTDADLEAAVAAAAARKDDVPTLMTLASVQAARGDYSEALASYYGAAELDKTLAGGPIREAMVNLFHVIGIRSELADEYRDKLRGLLY